MIFSSLLVQFLVEKVSHAQHLGRNDQSGQAKEPLHLKDTTSIFFLDVNGKTQ